MSLNCILKFLREARGKFPHGNIPRDSTGKGGGNIHIENSLHFPFISAGKSWGNFCKDDPLGFPNKSAWKSGGCGWLACWVASVVIYLHAFCKHLFLFHLSNVSPLFQWFHVDEATHRISTVRPSTIVFWFYVSMVFIPSTAIVTFHYP